MTIVLNNHSKMNNYSSLILNVESMSYTNLMELG